ncbi:MAG: hypothetical protein ACXWC6_06280, partial [Ramlibacter sp.]
MTFQFRAALALLAAAPCLAHADGAADLQSLRDEIATLRSSYEQRLQALEARLKAAEDARPAPAPAPAPATATAAVPALTPAPAGTPAMGPAVPPSGTQ